MNRLLLGCILFALACTASAEAPARYKIELIVFENLDPSALQAEDWPANPGTPSLDNAMELETLPAPGLPGSGAPAPGDDTVPSPAEPLAAAETVTAVPPLGQDMAQPDLAAVETAVEPVEPSWRWLTESELTLNDVERRLADSGRYRPLLHIGWVQPLDDSDRGTPVHLYDGLKPQAPPPPATVAGESIMVSPPAAPAAEPPSPPVDIPPPVDGAISPSWPEELPPLEPAPHRLNGTFTLRRGRYLHVDVDLDYRLNEAPSKTPPVEGNRLGERMQDAAPPPVARYVRMVQSRRIRSDELHYLDHPLFGVLFLVTPYPLPPAAEKP